jgi:hypothetical protein
VKRLSRRRSQEAELYALRGTEPLDMWMKGWMSWRLFSLTHVVNDFPTTTLFLLTE